MVGLREDDNSNYTYDADTAIPVSGGYNGTGEVDVLDLQSSGKEDTGQDTFLLHRSPQTPQQRNRLDERLEFD